MEFPFCAPWFTKSDEVFSGYRRGSNRRLWLSNGNQLIAGRLGAAVPGFTEEGDCAGASAQRKWRHCNSRKPMRCFPNLLERCAASQLLAISPCRNFLHSLGECIHAGISVFPWIDQRLRIERAD